MITRTCISKAKIKIKHKKGVYDCSYMHFWQNKHEINFQKTGGDGSGGSSSSGGGGGGSGGSGSSGSSGGGGSEDFTLPHLFHAECQESTQTLHGMTRNFFGRIPSQISNPSPSSGQAQAKLRLSRELRLGLSQLGISTKFTWTA